MSQEDDLLEDEEKPSFSVSVAPKNEKETPKTPAKGFVAPVKSAKNRTEDGEAPKPQASKTSAPSESKAKRPRKPPAKKRRTKKDGGDEDEDEESTVSTSQMKMVVEDSKEDSGDEDSDEEEEEEEEKEDPEDEDVAGKGYSTVVVFTSVPSNGRKGLVDAVRKHGAHMTRDVGLATHAVCAQPQRTIKLMCAILRGLWVVGTSWVTASQDKETMPSEEPFELSTYPGIRKSRLMHAEPGFKVCNTRDTLVLCILLFVDHFCCVFAATL